MLYNFIYPPKKYTHFSFNLKSTKNLRSNIILKKFNLHCFCFYVFFSYKKKIIIKSVKLASIICMSF